MPKNDPDRVLEEKVYVQPPGWRVVAGDYTSDVYRSHTDATEALVDGGELVAEPGFTYVVHRKVGKGDLHPHYVEHRDLYDAPVFEYFEVEEDHVDDVWDTPEAAHAEATKTGKPVYFGPHVPNAVLRRGF